MKNHRSRFLSDQMPQPWLTWPDVGLIIRLLRRARLSWKLLSVVSLANYREMMEVKLKEMEFGEAKLIVRSWVRLTNL